MIQKFKKLKNNEWEVLIFHLNKRDEIFVLRISLVYLVLLSFSEILALKLIPKL